MLTEKLTVRLSPGQVQVLDELKTKLGCSYSLLLRTIVGDWITQHEEQLERIITSNTEDDNIFEDAIHTETPEED